MIHQSHSCLFVRFVVAVFLLVAPVRLYSAEKTIQQPTSVRTAWGQIRSYSDHLKLDVMARPDDGVISIPRLNNPIRRVYWHGDADQRQLKFQPDVDQWRITLSEKAPSSLPATVILETEGEPRLTAAPRVVAASNGVVTLHAHDAVTHGKLLRYEPQPHKNTLGYWANADDWCQWHFHNEKAGSYIVEVLQGCGEGQGGSEVAVAVGTQQLRFTVEDTGHFQNFQYRQIGTLEIGEVGQHVLTIRPIKKAVDAIMDVRMVRLTPVATFRRPNIVLILADDQCYETLRCVGMEDIETPNLDRLTRRGHTFSNAYNMGSWSGAVCIASRTMLNTGRFLWHANDVWKSSEQERKAGRFWSEHMKSAGYDTYFTGKWHVPADATKAFEFADHVRGGMPKDTPTAYHRPLPGKVDVWKPWDRGNGGFWQGGKHWSEVVADDAVGFMQQAAKRDQPFFMYVAFNAPHDPRQSPQEFVEKYPLERVAVPVNFLAEYPYKDAIGCSRSLRDEKLGPFPRTEQAVKVHRQEYFAIITHMDQQIGRILDAIDESGKEDSTYIFFTADHGLAVGHHGLFGKQNMYDHSVRVPFIVVGPDVKHGKTSTPIYLQDVMPTSLELAGIEKPVHVQFNSLLPLICGDDVRPYDAMYGAYLRLQRMVTWGDYKLILYPQVGKARLFNLAEDPYEQNDLAEDETFRPLMRQLFSKLCDLQQQMGDTLDLKKTFSSLAI